MRILTGVTAVISAAHCGRDGVLHGHTWQITAWWEGGPDAIEKQHTLRNFLDAYDHSVLPRDVALGEALGRAVLTGVECCKVDVARPLEGIFAVVER